MKNILLFENYKEVDNFKILSEAILKNLVEEYSVYFKEFQNSLDFYDLREFVVFVEDNDSLNIDYIKRNGVEIRRFLNSKLFRDLEIRFVLLNDEYEGQYIMTRNILYVDISDMEDLVKDVDIPSELFLNRLYDKYVSVLIHELTHVYDYYKTNGYIIKSKDKKINKKINDEDVEDYGIGHLPLYYNLSYEIKSHLNQIIHALGDISKYNTFQELLNYINNLESLKDFYDNLETKNKQKVIKILYKVWSSER
jgi:hypothetical protein